MYSIGINSLNIRLFITALFYQYVLLMYILELEKNVYNMRYMQNMICSESYGLKYVVSYLSSSLYGDVEHILLLICDHYSWSTMEAFLFKILHFRNFSLINCYRIILLLRFVIMHLHISHTHIYFTLYIRKEHFHR